MNPLHALHEQVDAELQAYGDIVIVSTFGQPQAEYAAIRKGAAIMDQPYRGVIELTGKDRLSFLNNLLTNQVYSKQTNTALATHSGVYAFMLETTGRIICDMNVLELGDRTFLDVDGRMVDALLKVFDRYLFGEQVKLTSRADSLHSLFLTGPGALDVLNPAIEPKIGALAALGSAAGRVLGRDVVIFRDDVCGSAGYTMLCPIEAAEAIWKHFTPAASSEPSPLAASCARPVGWAAYNATRIEAGRPLFGIDFDNTMLPAETGQLARGVSFTKGCYLGQEIVARMQSRGQLAKQIVGIRMDDDALPIAGNKIHDEQQNPIGVITSSTISPVLSNAAICLGHVKKPFYSLGSKVRIPAEGAMRVGAVVALPFVG